MNVHAGNWEFVYMGYVGSRNCVCAYQCVCPQRTLIRGVLFDRKHLQAVCALAHHFANKSYLQWQ